MFFCFIENDDVIYFLQAKTQPFLAIKLNGRETDRITNDNEWERQETCVISNTD